MTQETKQQIESLLEALNILKEHYDDAFLLLARYNNVLRHYNKGLIEKSEFDRTVAQIKWAIKEIIQ
jgi:hypothetical protein